MRVNFDINLNKTRKSDSKLNTKKGSSNNNVYKYNTLSNNNCFANYYFNNINFSGNYLNKTSNADNFDIAGYENEKEKITDLLINPILKEKETGKEQYVPAGILLYAQDMQDAQDFINGISKISNTTLKQIDTESTEFGITVKNELKIARQNYINKKQRTVIVIKNANNLISNSKTNHINVVLMKSWLENCAKLPTDDISIASAVTFIFETDSPSSISSEILNHKNFAGIISLPLRNKENIKELIKSENKKHESSSKFMLSDKQAGIIADKLAPNEDGAYSTSRIKTILKQAKEDWEYSSGAYKDAILERIGKTRRNINSRTVKKSKENVKWLVKNNWIQGPQTKHLKEYFDRVIAFCDTIQTEEPRNGLETLYLENMNIMKKGIVNNPFVLKSTRINSAPLIDFWLDLSGEDITKYTSRLKNEWLDSVLKDPNKTSSLISQTLDKLQEENALIEAARTAYRDIIENEDEITPEQKEILIQQQDSKLFFQVVSNNLKPDDSIKLQLNTIETIRQLSKEKEEVKANARENIFDPARKLELEDEDSSDIVGYIFDLLSQKALTAPQQEKEELKALVENFEQAKDSGDTDEFNSIWQKLINIAQEYFETDELDNLTNTNIILLDSINKNMKDEKNQRIINLVNNPNLSVEQREFVSRYKDDKNFRLMINNPNVDSFSAIENLVYFEAGNKNLIQEAGLNYSDDEFNRIMSDKFHQIDKEAKDINVQGNRIVTKLSDINSSVNEFANGFSVYANSSLENQAKQLEQMYISNDLLSSIDKNTQEIKAYTQAQVRAKLVELEKDKYYKDIVPEITKLLPEDEQINLKDFLSKVDDLVKNEKDTKRKKAILTAAAVVAGTAIAAAAIYYVGPTVVAHLASKLPQGASAAQALTSTMGLVNKAKLLGNSKLISFLSRTVSQITTEIKAVERRIKQLQELIMKYPNDTSYAAELDRCHDRLGKLYAELGRATN